MAVPQDGSQSPPKGPLLTHWGPLIPASRKQGQGGLPQHLEARTGAQLPVPSPAGSRPPAQLLGGPGHSVWVTAWLADPLGAMSWVVGVGPEPGAQGWSGVPGCQPLPAPHRCWLGRVHGPSRFTAFPGRSWAGQVFGPSCLPQASTEQLSFTSEPAWDPGVAKEARLSHLRLPLAGCQAW